MPNPHKNKESKGNIHSGNPGKKAHRGNASHGSINSGNPSSGSINSGNKAHLAKIPNSTTPRTRRPGSAKHKDINP